MTRRKFAEVKDIAGGKVVYDQSDDERFYVRKASSFGCVVKYYCVSTMGFEGGAPHYHSESSFMIERMSPSEVAELKRRLKWYAKKARDEKEHRRRRQ